MFSSWFWPLPQFPPFQRDSGFNQCCRSMATGKSFFLPRRKTNRTLLLRGRRGHEFADGVEYHSELSVVFLLKRRELAREIGMRGEHLPQPHEGAHDFDVHMNSAFAVQDTGQHRDALFRKSIGRVASPAASALFV